MPAWARWLSRALGIGLIAGSIALAIVGLVRWGPVGMFLAPMVLAPVRSLTRGFITLRAVAAERARPLAALEDVADATRVHVRGTVVAAETLPSLVGERGDMVFRRVVCSFPETWVHEQAVPFAITDGQHTVQVDVDHARFAGFEGRKRGLVGNAPRKLTIKNALANACAPPRRSAEMEANLFWVRERAVRAGDTVEVLGYKRRAVAQHGESLWRDTPYTVSLTAAGDDAPLVLVCRKPYFTTQWARDLAGTWRDALAAPLRAVGRKPKRWIRRGLYVVGVVGLTFAVRAVAMGQLSAAVADRKGQLTHTITNQTRGAITGVVLLSSIAAIAIAWGLEKKRVIRRKHAVRATWIAGGIIAAVMVGLGMASP